MTKKYGIKPLTIREMFKKMEGHVVKDKHGELLRFVDGEKFFNQPGTSHGFIHLQNVKTGEYRGFAGVEWAYRNLYPKIENE